MGIEPAALWRQHQFTFNGGANNWKSPVFPLYMWLQPYIIRDSRQPLSKSPPAKLKMKPLLLIFLIVPLIEIYLLIQVGSAVGAGMTIFLVVFTAVLGAFLVRAQGISTLARVQRQVARGQPPAMELLEGLGLFLAGALLLTPGFFTDTFGFIILTPPLRRAMIHRIIRGRVVQPNVSFRAGQAPGGPGPHKSEQRVIDGEYRKID